MKHSQIGHHGNAENAALIDHARLARLFCACLAIPDALSARAGAGFPKEAGDSGYPQARGWESRTLVASGKEWGHDPPGR